MTWCSIPDFSQYEISKSGAVRKGDLILSQTTQTYAGVKLKNDLGQWKRVYVHRLVLATFVGPRPEGLVINHIDGNKENNNLDNLEYCTNLENERHSLDVLGKTHTRGKNGCFIAATTTEQRLV